MAHDHAHDHGDGNSYYIEQLFTIAVCGAIGGVMVLMYVSGRVRFLFGANETQHMRVLLGGAGLVAIVLIRAVYVWVAVGQKKPALKAHDHAHDDCGHVHGDCGHDHAHEHHHHEHAHEHHHHDHAHEEGIKVAASPALTSLPLAASTVPALAHTHDHGHAHDHGHDHGHGHDHDHDHDHGWAPWRFMLLLLPVILFFLGLPNQGILKGADESNLNEEDKQALAKVDNDYGKGDKVKPLSFLDLERASMNVNARDDLEGRLINVTGQYFGTDPHRFTLQRFKINCCAADAIPLNAVIMINPEDQKKYELSPGQYQGKWVSVTGRVYFLRQPNGEYRTAILIHPTKDKDNSVADLVKVIPAESNPYAS